MPHMLATTQTAAALPQLISRSAGADTGRTAVQGGAAFDGNVVEFAVAADERRPNPAVPAVDDLNGAMSDCAMAVACKSTLAQSPQFSRACETQGGASK